MILNLVPYLVSSATGSPHDCHLFLRSPQTRQREIVDIARKDVVHITENGSAAFVFMSEDLFEEQLNNAAEEAALTERMRACIKASDDCFEQGEYIEGTDAFFSALDEAGSQCG